jgi:hypothetical protein
VPKGDNEGRDPSLGIPAAAAEASPNFLAEQSMSEVGFADNIEKGD